MSDSSESQRLIDCLFIQALQLLVNWHALLNGNEKVVYLGQMLHRSETVGVTLPRAAYWDDEQISKGLNPSFQRILSVRCEALWNTRRDTCG